LCSSAGEDVDRIVRQIVQLRQPKNTESKLRPVACTVAPHFWVKMGPFN